MKFDVHIYVLIRVPVKGVEADDAISAAKRAEAETNLEQFVTNGADITDSIESFLVDTLDEEGKLASELDLDADFVPKVFTPGPVVTLQVGPNTGDEFGDWEGDKSVIEHTK
jgi:hypothetical protein